MVDVDTLRIVIDIVDEFSDEIRELQSMLLELNTLAEALDTITINVKVRGEREVDSLMAKLAALELQEALTGVGINVGAGGGGRGGGGSGGGAAAARGAASAAGGAAGVLDGVDMKDFSRAIDNVSDQADNMADAVQSPIEQLKNIDLSMSDMHNALAALVPLILVVIGALPALITGFVAVAAAALSAAVALGALTGLGFLGAAMARAGGERPSMEELGDVMSEIIDELFDAFAPAMQALAPIFEQGLDGLGQFADGIAGAAMHLQQLGDEAGGFARFFEEFLAGAIVNMVAMTEAFAPLFGMLGDFLNNFSILEELTVLMGEMAPAFLIFIGLVTDMLPMIVRLSIGFLMVTNAVLGIIDVMLHLARIISGNNLPVVGALIAGLLAATTAAVILGFAIRANVISTLALFAKVAIGAIAQLGALAAAKIATAGAAGILALSLKAVAAGIIAVLAATGIGILLPILGGIAAGFLGIASGAKDATKSLKDFNRMSNRFEGGTNPFAPSPTQEGGFFGRSARQVTINNNVEGNADETALATSGNRTLWVERTLGGARGGQ